MEVDINLAASPMAVGLWVCGSMVLQIGLCHVVSIFLSNSHNKVPTCKESRVVDPNGHSSRNHANVFLWWLWWLPHVKKEHVF